MGPPQTHMALCPALIGRDEEFAALDAALQATEAGYGSVALILGEAGIGKSRLVREVAAEARSRDFRVLLGRAVQTESPVPFRALAEALLSYVRVAGPPIAPELAPFRPALGRLVPEWHDNQTARADESIVVLGEAVLRLLRAISGDHGCLLVLEDLHWADPETVAILEYLSDNLGSESVLCLGTLRAEETSPALRLAHSLQARRSTLALELRHLSGTEVETMAEACLGMTGIPQQVAMLLRSCTDGLPFLVEELLAASMGSGALVQRGDAWEGEGAIEPVVPLTFADTVRRRLSALGPTPRRVLHAAAILGRHFDWSLLPAITGLEEEAVLEALRRAIDVQLIVAEGAGSHATFRFRHALSRDAVRDELLPPERANFSRRTLEVVQATHPGLSGEWCELAAELAGGAGDYRQAATFLLEAGRRALARGALVSAEASLDRARRSGPPRVHGEPGYDDPALRVEIDEALTEVLSLAGKTDGAVQVGEALLATLTAMNAPAAQRAGVHLHLARATTTASLWTTAMQHLAQARKLAVEASNDGLLAQVDALSAHVAIGNQQPEEATVQARAALEAAERLALPEIACEALEVIGRSARLHDLAQAESAFDRARIIAEEHGLALWRIRALHELGTIDLLNAAPVDRLARTRELAMQAGALATAAVVDLQMGGGLLLQFDLEGGLAVLRRSAELARRFHLDPVLGMALILQGAALAYHGRRAEMETILDEALRVAGEQPDVSASVWGERGTLSLLQENRKRALQELDRAMEIIERAASTSPHPFRGLWALVHTLEGDEAAYAVVRASGVTVHRVNRGILSFAEAVILGRADRRAEAEAAFARGEAEFSPLPLYRHLAHRLVAEAALEDGWGDPVASLREALIFFDGQDNQRVVSACRSLLRKAGAPVPRKGRGETEVPATLRALGVTTREMDVLTLLGEGLSNREIAVRLYLSPRTVEKHVENLADKTGTQTRSQLVAFAAARAALDAGSP